MDKRRYLHPDKVSDVNWMIDKLRYLQRDNVTSSEEKLQRDKVTSSKETERLKRSTILWVDTKEPSPTLSPLEWVIPLHVVQLVLVVLISMCQVVYACKDYQESHRLVPVLRTFMTDLFVQDPS